MSLLTPPALEPVTIDETRFAQYVSAPPVKPAMSRKSAAKE